MLVRSWNLFHGNTSPPGRWAHLEEMVRLAASDAPAIVLLQEIPVWALPRLARWSGMTAIGNVAQRPRLGPLPITAILGGGVTRLRPGLLRSAFSGQGNAILLGPGLEAADRRVFTLNALRFRRRCARNLDLGPLDRLAWAKERRICQVVRLRLREGGTLVVAHLHATSARDERIPAAETRRAAALADALTEPGEPLVLGGDLNVAPGSPVLADLSGPHWGFSAPGPWIDHILVRGAACTPLAVWPEERRRHNGLVLSDHAPVELELTLR